MNALAAYFASAPHGEKSRVQRDTGLAYTTIHWIATGKTRPRVETAQRIAAVIPGLTAGQILGLEPYDQPEAAE